METIRESRVLETKQRADLVVVGGGPGGIAAALAASRHGMHVILIEKQAILGGLATAGHICLFEPLCDGYGHKVTSGIAEELLHRSIAYSYNTLPSCWGKDVQRVENLPEHDDPDMEEVMDRPGRYATLFNIPAYVLSLEELVRQAGIELMYDTLFCGPVMDGEWCRGVIVENLSGRYVIACKAIIDASGSSLFFDRAGAETATYKNRFTFEFLDTTLARMEAAVKNHSIAKAIHWQVIGWNPLRSDPRQANELPGLTAEDINNYLFMSHDAALDFLKKQGDDYAMLSLPTMPQIRMTRRIAGLYEMRPDDVFKTMDDSVGCVSDWRRSGPVYEVPYRCLLDRNICNAAAAGRNIAAQNDMWDVMRCYPGSITTGQAAGTAAALAVAHGIAMQEVPISELQTVLKRDGVIVHQPKLD